MGLLGDGDQRGRCVLRLPLELASCHLPSLHSSAPHLDSAEGPVVRSGTTLSLAAF